MRDLPVPVVRCELPIPDAVVVEHPEAGRFVLVDHRVADADLARLAERLLVEVDLHGAAPRRGRAADRIRRAIAAEMTARTRAHLARPSRRPLSAVGARPPPTDLASTRPAAPPVETVRTGDDEPFAGHLDLRLDRAHSARVYDVLLGGKTNYWPDRVAADAIVAAAPTTPLAARAQRAFMHRAVTFLAGAGFDQFLDIGTGIPTEPNLHQIAQAVDPTAHVVYVDNDPIVLAHAAALMISDRRGAVSYVNADARTPELILGADAVATVLDLDRPVAVSTVGLLHFLDDDDAERLVATMLDAVVPGSALVFSQVTPDFDENRAMVAAAERYQAAGIPLWPRTAGDIRRLFLGGLEVVEPGLVGMLRWRADIAVPLNRDLDSHDLRTAPDADVSIYAVLARKPVGQAVPLP